jgi:uncharacterized membrane protein
MFTKIVKYASIVALLISLWRFSFDYRMFAAFVVTIGAVAVATQATRAQRTAWAIAFGAIATVLNPVVTGQLGRAVFFWCDVLVIAAFAASIVFLKTQPVLSMPSITDRTPSSESL